MNVDEYNKELWSTWSIRKSLDLFPINNEFPLLIPTEPPKHAIAVVGMNPSLTKADKYNSLDKDLEPKKLKQALKLAQLENYSKLRYFTEIKNFFDEENISSRYLWFVDIFPIRHTKQKEVEKFLNKNCELKEKFLQLFLKLMRAQDLSLIVILNAKASSYFHSNKLLKSNTFKSSSKKNLSHSQFFMSDGQFVPIIFAGMITGQGQMDIYSRSRLLDQIQQLRKI